MAKEIKTIVHVLNTGTFSGAENVVITLIRNMMRLHPQEYKFIYVSLKGDIEKRLRKEKISYYPVDRLSIGTMRGMIKQCRPDIIHAHDFTASMLCAAVSFQVRVISHLHCNPPWMRTKNLKSVLYFLTTLRYRSIVTVSEAVGDEYIFGSKIKNKILIEENPVDRNDILKRADDCLGESYDIVFLGRLSPPKNPLRFLRIQKEIVRRKSNIKSVMIGDGELKKKCNELIERENLKENVKLNGFMENPYPTLKNAKLLCVTSDWEGFGLMAAEALVLGVPVVSTYIGGLKKVVNDSCGKFCSTDGEFTSEIIKLLENTDYREKLSAGARERGIELDNMDTYTSDMTQLYTSLS